MVPKMIGGSMVAALLSTPGVDTPRQGAPPPPSITGYDGVRQTSASTARWGDGFRFYSGTTVALLLLLLEEYRLARFLVCKRAWKNAG